MQFRHQGRSFARRGAALALAVGAAAFLTLNAAPTRAADFDQNWFNQMPGGSAIKVGSDLKVDGKTARGQVKLNGNTAEIAAGMHDNGQIVMWEVKDFTLSSVHDSLDVFPLNEMELPHVLMVLVKGAPKNIKVGKLPGELKKFAERVLEDGDMIVFKQGLNLYGRFVPSDMPKNVKNAFEKIGIKKTELVLGGAIGNLLTKPRAAVVDLYATLPEITYPDVLKKVLKFAGRQQPTLFVGASAGSKDKADAAKSKSASARFGVSNNLALSVGNKDFDFVGSTYMTLQKTGIGLKTAIAKPTWNDALGIKNLDLDDLKIEVGVNDAGSVTFGLKGGMKVEKRENRLAISAAINPATGIDPRELLFYLKSPEVSLAQFAKISDILIGGIGGNSDIAKAARGKGLFSALQLDKLPSAEIVGLKKGEDVQLIVSGPNASDPALGIAGLTALAKGRLMVWDTEIGMADAKVTLTGLDILGKLELKKIGPLDLSAAGTGKKSRIYAKAGLSSLPEFKLYSMSKILGVEKEREIELTSERIYYREGFDFAGLAETSIEAGTVGEKLSRIKGFSIKGEARQDVVEKALDYVRDGIKAAYEDVNEKVLDKVLDNIRKNAKLFAVKGLSLKGEATTTGRDSLTMTINAVVAGHDYEPSAKLRGLDKKQVAEAVADMFKDLGRKIFAFKMPSFDKDLIRKRSDEMYFYEGNDCTQEIAGTLPFVFGKGDSHTTKAKDVDWFQNDEARSVLLRTLKKGVTVALYDNPDGKMTDDVTVIEILKDREKGACIKSFESSKMAKDGSWRVYVLHKNGIDGKVSRVKQAWGGSRAAHPDDIVFYEGKECSQDIRGVYSSDRKYDDNCKDTGRCKNDEIKSVRLMGWGRDPYKITLYDHPKAKKSDDWVTIEVDPRKMDRGWHCIDSLERDFKSKDGSFKQDFHKHNGLNGKVSHITINP